MANDPMHIVRERSAHEHGFLQFSPIIEVAEFTFERRSHEVGFLKITPYPPDVVEIIRDRQHGEFGFVLPGNGLSLANLYPNGPPCQPPTTLTIEFDISSILPPLLDLTTLVVTLAGVTAYDGSAGGFQPGYSGLLTDISTPFVDARHVEVTKTGGFNSGQTIQVTATVEDNMGGTLQVTPVVWTVFACDTVLLSLDILPEFITATSTVYEPALIEASVEVTPSVVSSEGGTILLVRATAFTVPSGTYRMYLGAAGNSTDPIARPAQLGSGLDVEVATDPDDQYYVLARIIAPALPASTPGAPYDLTLEGNDSGTTINISVPDVLEVVPRTFNSSLMRARKNLGQRWALGPRSTDTIPEQ